LVIAVSTGVVELAVAKALGARSALTSIVGVAEAGARVVATVGDEAMRAAVTAARRTTLDCRRAAAGGGTPAPRCAVVAAAQPVAGLEPRSAATAAAVRFAADRGERLAAAALPFAVDLGKRLATGALCEPADAAESLLRGAAGALSSASAAGAVASAMPIAAAAAPACNQVTTGNTRRARCFFD